ncbi:MAG: TonB-dependent receptor [Prolixibacteraceae bacterium]|jgi:outer membrane receptor for ferrienterochelin and colicins|nr:TonB-dependent receptor [Prolixibacteraceae bacterium]
MTFLKKAGLVAFTFLFAISLNAQYSISGRVVHSENGGPLAGAHIYLQGTTLGTASGTDGEFTIHGISKGVYTIRVSFFGFATHEQVLEINGDINNFSSKLEPTSIDLNAVVVTGTRTERTLKNTPVLTHVIGKNTLGSQAVTYLPQALAQNDASFEMFRDNTVNSFSLDGLGAEYVLFLIDGERIAGETKGVVELSRINPESIERVEMIKGAASTLYGSNAIGGVVNVITKQVSQPLELRAGVKTSLFTDPAEDKTRSDNYYFAGINLSGNKLSSFTDFKVNQYAPYDLSGGAGIYGIMTQEKENNFVINQKLNYRASDKFSVSARASFFQLDTDYKLENYPDKLNRDFTWGAKASYYPSAKAKYELSYHSDHNKIFDVTGTGEQLDYDNLYNNLRLLATLKSFKNNIITGGFEHVGEKQSSVQNNIDDKAQNNVILYAQDEFEVNDLLTLTGGARLEFHSVYGEHFTPQVSAMLSPGNFKIRGGYGKGFRAPTVKELYTDHYQIPVPGAPFPMYLDGNTALKPEESNYYSASVQYANKKIDVSAIYSVNEISNLITTDSIYNVVMDFTVMPPRPSEIHYIYSNVEEARISSLSFLLKYRLTGNLTFSASLKYSDPKNLTGESDLLNIRKKNARFNLDYQKDFGDYRLDVNLNSSYYGEKTVADIYSQQGGTKNLGGFNLWKLTTVHTFNERFTITLGVSNIFDITDEEPRYFNLTTPGRMYVAGVSVNL